jgi:hypothetical protein
MNRLKTSSIRNRGGYFVMDILAGLALLVALAWVLAVTVTKHSAATQRLAEHRAADRAAEAALAALQAGQPAGNAAEGVAIVVTTLDSPAPIGCRWVRVDLKSNNGRGTRASLIGVVPTTQSTKGGAE